MIRVTWCACAAIVCLTGGIAQLSSGDEQGSPGPAGVRVEFVVGDYLTSEGGDWDPAEGPLRQPFGVDFDAQGSMYCVELASGRVLKRTAAGGIETLRGEHPKGYGGDSEVVSDANFNGPHNCVVDEGSLLIADSWNHCVRRVDLENLVVDTIAGTGVAGFSGDGGSAREARFDFVMCVALDRAGKKLHITDLNNRRIRNLDLSTGIVTTVAGNGEKGVPSDGDHATESPLVDPRAAESDAAGNLYILERGGHALRVVRGDGTIHTVAGTGVKGFRDGAGLEAQFGSPKHLCCDPAGNVYIADDLNGAIRRYDPATGVVTTVLGRGFGDQRVTLKNPHGVRWHDGWLYVVDMGNGRILRVKVGR